MNPKPIRLARDPDLANALAALQRAGQRARETALQTGTLLAVWRDGRCVLVSPEIAENEAETNPLDDSQKSSFPIRTEGDSPCCP